MNAPAKITGSLLDHDAEAQRLLALMDEHAGDDEALAAILEEYVAAEQRIGVKLDNTAGVIEELRARAEFYRVESARWNDRGEACDKQADRLAEHLRRYMQAREMKRFDGARYTLRLQAAGGKRRVEITDIEKLPPDLVEERVTTRIVAKKAEVLERLEAGEHIDGAYLAPRKINLKIG